MTSNDAETYLNLMDAIQAHITAVCGENVHARDWVLTCGVEDLFPDDASMQEIRVERSPGSALYTVTGLLNWALDCYSPIDFTD